MDFKFFIGRQFELEPTQLSSLRLNEFKFFHGLLNGRTTVVWMPETDGREYYDITEQLTRLMSREIDNDIIRQLTTMVGDVDQISVRNVNADYLQRYLDMGENRA